MNLLDILLALPLCFFIYKGWRRGLVREVVTLAGILVGVWAATHLSADIAQLLPIEGENAPLVAFIITFIASLLLAYLLGRLVEGMLKMVKLSLVNRLLGALLGAGKALVVLSIVLNLIVTIDKKEWLLTSSTKEASLLYRPVQTTGDKLTAELKEAMANYKEHRKEAKQ